MKRLLLLMLSLGILTTACHDDTPIPVQIQGTVVIESFDPDQYFIYPEGTTIEVLSAAGEFLGKTQTNRIGQYQLNIEGVNPGDELRVRASYADPKTKLTLSTAKRAQVNKERIAYVPQLTFVYPEGSELTRYQNSWHDESGNVQIEDPDGRFSRVWARAFDPEFDRPFFPGDYRDADGIKIISNGFLFVSAQDASGKQVTSLVEPVTTYFYIPTTHRYYLRDVTPNNGLYEVPMYLYNEAQDTWVRRGTGVVVDAGYQPVPESDEEQITTDPNYGRLFVMFKADHFSIWNIDHQLPPCKQ